MKKAWIRKLKTQNLLNKKKKTGLNTNACNWKLFLISFLEVIFFPLGEVGKAFES